jgi:hypothetical protein
MNLYSPRDFTENAILAGPRYQFNFGNLHPYIKAVGGRGMFQFEKGYFAADSTQYYTVVAGAGGVDYQFSHHFIGRAEFEYQDWVNFKPDQLTPYVATIGIAYRFHGASYNYK